MNLAIVKNKDIQRATRKALEKIGGINFKKPDPLVLIKPNVNTCIPCPGSTSPEVIKEIVKLVKEAGAKRIIVGDRSYNPLFINSYTNTLKNMEKNGVKEIAESEGAKVVGFEKEEWVKVKPGKATHWPFGFSIPKILTEADYIISVPVLKTHQVTEISFSLKNSVGIIHSKDRIFMHISDLHEKIAEINLAFKPDLIVVDGSRSFVAGGPNEGEVVESNLIIAGKSRVEVDKKCYETLVELGGKLPLPPENHPMIKHAIKIGIE